MRSLIVIAGLVLASCTANPPGTGSADAFARETAGRVAGPAQACISTFPAQNLRVIDQSTLAYGHGPTIFVNRLAGPCPALSQFNTLIVDASTGGQYCSGDGVRGLETGGIIPGPRCNLGQWTPYRMQ
jgi:hypothetical protein